MRFISKHQKLVTTRPSKPSNGSQHLHDIPSTQPRRVPHFEWSHWAFPGHGMLFSFCSKFEETSMQKLKIVFQGWEWQKWTLQACNMPLFARSLVSWQWLGQNWLNFECIVHLGFICQIRPKSSSWIWLLKLIYHLYANSHFSTMSTSPGGGFNNARMSMETIVVMAHAMGRTLVMPPSQVRPIFDTNFEIVRSFPGVKEKILGRKY